MTTVNITIHPEDFSQIEAVKAFMNASKIKFEIKENASKLTDEQKSAIDEAIESIEKKGLIEHHVVMEETKKRFAHLYKR
jgi:predicted transcriptional regulator